MLMRNDVVQIEDDPPRRMRVLWLSVDTDKIVVIDVDAKTALPELRECKWLLESMAAGVARLLGDECAATFASESALKESHKQRRDRAWSLIRDLVVAEPQIYTASYRGKEVTRLVTQMRSGADEYLKKTTNPQIYLYLRRYWQRGMNINALLPDYAHCGGPGKPRASGEKKRGRPRKYGSAKGINITEDIRQVFRVGFDRCYASDRKRTWTLRDAFDRILADFFCEKHIDSETGKVSHAPTDDVEKAGGLPTFGQFQYWADKDHTRLSVQRRRLGARIYDKDMRGLLGTSNAEVLGPGDRYQIDATIADVYLVSRLDRHRIVGRPVLYVVIDVFSRMIVGVYVGLEGPSWVGAMMALANTAADKVRFCKDHEIQVEPEDWPCNFLPGILLGDRGEIESNTINTLSNTFNVTIENAAAYRADWKGIVERRFRLLPAKFQPFVPGYIQQDFRARGGRDYRLDAVLDIEEFTQIIIDCVLFYNNHHEISKYDKDRDVLADGVPAIPLELWEWGRQHRSGAMRAFPENLVQYSLLPRGKAWVTEHGIHFKSAFYACPMAIEARWFDKARQEGRWQVEVAYEPRCMDAICLPGTGERLSYHVCKLTPRSRALQQMSLCEIEQQIEIDKHEKAGRGENQQMARLDLADSIERRVKSAIAKMGEPSSESDASRTNKIRQNRFLEKQVNRQLETFRLGHAAPGTTQPSADVVQFPSKAPSPDEPDYSMPSLDEILGSDDDN